MTLKILAYQRGFDGIRGLAQAAGVKPGTLYSVVCGHRSLGYGKKLALCRALDVTEEELDAAIAAGLPSPMTTGGAP